MSAQRQELSQEVPETNASKRSESAANKLERRRRIEEINEERRLYRELYEF